jgi:hypothetical protein
VSYPSGATRRRRAPCPARLPGPPTPEPITTAPAVKASDRGNGIDGTTIALGIAGSLLAVSAIAALASRGRQLRHERATA